MRTASPATGSSSERHVTAQLAGSRASCPTLTPPRHLWLSEVRTDRGSGTVAIAFLIVMAFAALPTPFYGLTETATTCLRSRSPSSMRSGRAARSRPCSRSNESSPASGTATVYLIELRVRSDPKASVVRARTIGTSVNMGALGIGLLIGGRLAQWADWPLTRPYLVFAALGAVTLIGLASAPETGSPASRDSSNSQPTTSRRSARLPVPAAAATFTAFAANGLFAGLSGLFLSTTLGHPSHALAGFTLFLVFSAGVVSQLATTRWHASRVLALGTLLMVAGLILLVIAVRLPTPSLAMFLISGVLIGAGAGAVFKGTTGIVLEANAHEDRVAMTSALLIALFVGLSVPVVGAGIALNAGAAEGCDLK